MLIKQNFIRVNHGLIDESLNAVFVMRSYFFDGGGGGNGGKVLPVAFS